MFKKQKQNVCYSDKKIIIQHRHHNYQIDFDYITLTIVILNSKLFIRNITILDRNRNNRKKNKNNKNNRKNKNRNNKNSEIDLKREILNEHAKNKRNDFDFALKIEIKQTKFFVCKTTFFVFITKRNNKNFFK